MNLNNNGFASNNPSEQYERNNFFVERMGIERSIAQEVGGTLDEPFAPYPHDAEILKILERDKDRLSGRTPIDPGFPEESCAKIEKWIRNGPCIGIKYPGTGKRGVTCSHPNNDPIDGHVGRGQSRHRADHSTHGTIAFKSRNIHDCVGFLRKMDAVILRRFPPKIFMRSAFEISASKTLPSSVA